MENGEITYTFTIQNTGAMAVDAADALVLRDTFNPALEAPIAVNLNGAAWPQEGNYTYNAATGEFVTTAGAITVPAATYTQDAATRPVEREPGRHHPDRARDDLIFGGERSPVWFFRQSGALCIGTAPFGWPFCSLPQAMFHFSCLGGKGRGKNSVNLRFAIGRWAKDVV